MAARYICVIPAKSGMLCPACRENREKVHPSGRNVKKYGNREKVGKRLPHRAPGAGTSIKTPFRNKKRMLPSRHTVPLSRSVFQTRSSHRCRINGC